MTKNGRKNTNTQPEVTKCEKGRTLNLVLSQEELREELFEGKQQQLLLFTRQGELFPFLLFPKNSAHLTMAYSHQTRMHLECVILASLCLASPTVKPI